MMADIPATSTSGIATKDELADIEMTTIQESNDIPSVVQAFSIDLVLENIARNLNLSDLKKFSLINKTANEAAYTVMQSEDLTVIRFKYDKKLEEFVTTRGQSVDDFIQLVLKKKNFPRAALSFVGGNLGSDELKRLFHIIGPRVKNLKIIPEDWKHYPLVPGDQGLPRSVVYTTQKDFADLLQYQLPNVETLHIGSFDFKWEHTDKDNIIHHRRLTLPALKYLYCVDDDVDDQVAGLEMIHHVPNLKTVHGFKERYYDRLSSANKIATIRGYVFRAKRDRIPSLIQFSQSQPMLESIDLRFDLCVTSTDYQQVSVALNRILLSSRNSLKSLRLNIRALYGGIEFPELRSLKNLTLDLADRRWYVSDYLQNYNRLTKTNATSFPNVETVSVFYQPCSGSMECDGDDCNRDNVPTFIGNFPTVHTLQIYHPCMEPTIYEYKILFPNVKKVRIESYTYSLMREIVEFYRSVEEIEFIGLILQLDLDLDCSEFIGVNCAKLTKLHKSGKPMPPFENAKKAPTMLGRKLRLGLADATCLRKLKLLYDQSSCSPPYDRNIFTLSALMFMYGFDLMPELQVTIAYDHHSVIAPEIATSLQRFLPHPRISVIHEVYEATPFIYLETAH